MSKWVAKHFVIVDVASQTLKLLCGGTAQKSWSISTAKNGLGFDEGSYKTPPGLHYIAKKIGQGERFGAVFKGRKDTGRTWPQDGPETKEDLILSRILWLAGGELKNANTFSRYIYIHGTNHEKAIGRPLSQGCIRMLNTDVIEIYDALPLRTPVLIF